MNIRRSPAGSWFAGHRFALFVGDGAFLKGLALLVVSGALWGVIPALSRTVTLTESHPIGLALLQNLLGTILCLGICYIRGKLRWPSRQEFRFYVQWAILYAVLNQVFVYWLTERLEATIVSFVIVLEGFAVFLAAALFRIEQPCLRRCVGLAAGLAGTLFLLFSHKHLGTSADIPMLLIALLVPCCYAAEDLFIAARKPDGTDPILALTILMACSVPMLAAFAALTGDFLTISVPFGRVEWVTVALVLVSVLAYLSFFELIASSGAVFAGQVCYVTTLSGMIWGTLLLGETLTHGMIIALACVMLGLLLVQPRALKPKAVVAP